MQARPEMATRGRDEVLPVRPLAQAKSAANDDGFRIEGVHEQTDLGFESLAGRFNDLPGAGITRRRCRQHFLPAYRFSVHGIESRHKRRAGGRFPPACDD